MTSSNTINRVVSLKILVACEESQAVTKELRALGHEAYSCDILPCSGGHPEWHLQQDVTGLLEREWDMVMWGNLIMPRSNFKQSWEKCSVCGMRKYNHRYHECKP